MLQGVSHQPYGQDDLYSTEPTERFPRDPMVGDTVFINMATWPTELGQTVWITWTKNGVAQPSVGAQWQSSSQNTSYWQASLGGFARGDTVEYFVHANQNQANEQVIGPFAFNVTSWSGVTSVKGYKDNSTSLDIQLDDSDGSFTPVLRLGFPAPDTFHVQFSPTGKGLTIADQKIFTVTELPEKLRVATSELVLHIQKAPYHLSVYKPDERTLITQQYDPSAFRNLGWASDGKNIITKIEDHYQTAMNESFTGFGERYDYLDLRGHDVNTFIYNEYGDQGPSGRTYLAVPFFINSAGYGIYVSTTAYSVFNVATYRTDMVGFTVSSPDGVDPTLEYYFFAGSPKTILDRYTGLTGRPQLPPKWAFGLWVSANEWNNEVQVHDLLNTAQQNQIPITVLVLEQWSDEATFYIWHGAQYTPKSGNSIPHYADFTFPTDGNWHDPRAMVSDAHKLGVHVVLWQLPALKEHFAAQPNPHYPATAPQQHLNDKRYAIQKGYIVKDETGGPYRMPTHPWAVFRGSTVPDFTKPEASAWWMSKRAYLLDEVGIDGFKCDSGEAIFGRSTTFANGRKGDVMHNGYPSTYTGTYDKYIRSRPGRQGVVFSRAGSASPQALSIYWAGDQYSTFDAFQQAIRAGLSAGQSGIPFWGWDLAGFADWQGSSPSSELYLRATAMATFCPIMQLHSQWAAPNDTKTRLPWRIQALTGDPQVSITGL